MTPGRSRSSVVTRGGRATALVSPRCRLSSPSRDPRPARATEDARAARGSATVHFASRGVSAKRLPSVAWNSDHHPNGCSTGGCGNSTPRALIWSYVSGQVVAVEHDVRGRQPLRSGRPLALPQAQNDGHRSVGRPHLEPAFLAVGRVLDEFEAERLRPEGQRAILVVDLEDDLMDSPDHLLPPYPSPGLRSTKHASAVGTAFDGKFPVIQTIS
jgi:hypothetical protein